MTKSLNKNRDYVKKLKNIQYQNIKREIKYF